MLHFVQKSANKRSSQMAHKVLSLLNADESVINLSKARETAEIISMGLTNKGNKRDKINKLIKLAAKHSNQTDFDMGDSHHSSNINFDNVRVTLREQLKIADESLTQHIKKNIQHQLETNLLVDTAFRIVLDFRPKLIDDFVMSIEKVDFPKTFASEEEWYGFKKKIIQPIMPKFGERVLMLKEEHSPILEQFIKGNIFFLDCLQQSKAINYSDYVFSIAPLTIKER